MTFIACNQTAKENMVLLNHSFSLRAGGHSLNIEKECRLPQIFIMVLTFRSVFQKAPRGSAWPVCGILAETPQKKTSESPAPPTRTKKRIYFRTRETKHRNSSRPSEHSLLISVSHSFSIMSALFVTYCYFS